MPRQRSPLSRSQLRRPGSLHGRRVGLLGFGQENQALTSLLMSEGAEVVVFDRQDRLAMPPEAQALLDQFGLRLISGDRYLRHLTGYDLLLRSPGLSTRLVKRSVDVETLILPAIELFLLRVKATVVGVTGTKGKGTTSSLIAHFLAPTGRRIELAGNIGRSAADLLDELHRGDIVILELSSFQLEDMQTSPDVAVVLPVTTEHLAPLSAGSPNFHLTAGSYRRAKESILRFQTERNTAIVSVDGRFWRRFAAVAAGELLLVSGQHRLNQDGVYFDGQAVIVRRDGRKQQVLRRQDSPLFGEHSWTNVTAAVAAALSLDAPIRQLKKQLITYQALPHRLQPVAEVGGVLYVDDSYGTNPDSAAAAIRAFNRPLIVIVGGSTKRANFGEVIQAVQAAQVKQVFGIGQEAPRLQQLFVEHGLAHRFDNVQTLDRAFQQSRQIAKAGDIVLLSPACASFDQFQNAADRGDQFQTMVHNLAEHR